MSCPPPAAIGVDLGGTKIEAIVLDLPGPHGPQGADAASLWRERVPTPAGDYAATVATIAALVERAERECGFAGCTVGIGTPGTETAAGLIKNANSTCLNGRPLGRDLAAALRRPVRLANDANCLALSEATDGAAAGAAVSFSVILGTGVGGGIVAHGRLLAGANGLAGEWGHCPLPWPDAAEQRDAPACYCGRRGCLETWLSGPGMARDHARHTGAALAPPQIAERAARGDAACEATLQRHESRLARGLAMVIDLIDPDVIVLAGGLSRLDRLVRNVPARWAPFVFGGGDPPDALRTRLVASAHGDSSGVRGAAWLWRGG